MRRFLSLFLWVLAMLFGVLGAAVPLLAADNRPNILFVFADDWGRYASAYAAAEGAGTPSDVVRTPNFDRIAREGVLFRHAFVNAPSCTPCRSALLSGQYFWRTGRGAILHGAEWDETIPTFPLLLRDSGYHIAKSHKVWSPGTPVDAPYGRQKYAYEKAGRRYNNFSENVTAMVERGRSVDDAKNALLDEVTGNFTAMLADRKPGQPFCYWFGPTLVHRKWIRGSGKALWGLNPDELQGKLPAFLPDVPEVREDFADYLGEIQGLDAGLGRLLAALKAAGELEKTVIVVSGDHGPPGFTHGKCNLYDFGVRVSLAVRGPGIPAGRVVDDFVNLMDLAPTFLELGEVKPPAVMTGRSLVPVLRSDKEGTVDGERAFVITGRERHVANARAGNVPYPSRAIRTAEHLFIINFMPERWPMGDPIHLDKPGLPTYDELCNDTYATFMDMDAGPTKAWLVMHRDDPAGKRYFDLAFAQRPREELYVLASDPQQMENVADRPELQKVRDQLKQTLLDELRRTDDPRATGGEIPYERLPFTGPPPASQR